MKTKIVLIAALLLGSLSAALADGEFDPNLANRYPAYNGPSVAQRAATQVDRGFARAPARLGNDGRAPFAVAPQMPGYHPNADFRYGPQIDYPQSPAGGGY